MSSPDGMFALCSIVQGFNASSLRQSPLSGSALNGNMDTFSIISRQSLIGRIVNGIPGFYSGAENTLAANPVGAMNVQNNIGFNMASSNVAPPPTTMADALTRKWTFYASREDASSWNGNYGDSLDDNGQPQINPSGYGSLSATLNSIVTSNFPSVNGTVVNNSPTPIVVHNWDEDSGLPTPAVLEWESIVGDSYLEYGIMFGTTGLPYVCCNAKIASTLSGQIDVSANFGRAKTDLLNKPFDYPFNTNGAGGYGLSYNCINAQAGTDYSSYSSASYDDSLEGGSAGYYSAPLPNVACFCGWTITEGNDSGAALFHLSKGEAKLSGSTQIGTTYCILYYQAAQPMATWDATTGYPTSFTGTHWSYNLSVVGAGFISGSQIIGYDGTCDIHLPFPSDAFPINAVSGVGVGACYYAAIIGQDPGTWAKANGMKFGTVFA